MDDGEVTTFNTRFKAHGNTWIDVVYTNDPLTINRILDMYEDWLRGETHRFVGLDLEYDRSQRKLAVVQLAMKQHVLVYHYIRYVSSLLPHQISSVTLKSFSLVLVWHAVDLVYS